MSLKKIYPPLSEVINECADAADALIALSEMGIKIIFVSFMNTQPIIEVNDCPGTSKIEGFFTGQGENIEGRYLRKMAFIKGCRIQWNEARE